MVVTLRHIVVRLARDADMYAALEQSRDLAVMGGFDSYRLSDIETAVSELCTNALRHGTRGWATFRLDSSAFEATIEDEGPGFGHAETLRTGLGIGLEGARRLMDTLTVDERQVGAAVTATRRRSRGRKFYPTWRVRAGWRTKPGSSSCGDQWESSWDQDMFRVAIADGLGSGVHAAHAARAAVAVIRDAPAGSPATLLARAGASCTNTRGAVGIVAEIDSRKSVLRYAGVGDVSAWVLPAGSSLISRPGILGRPFHPEEFELTFEPGSTLVMWTDGVRLRASDVERTDGPPSGRWVEGALKEHGSDADDGLIVVASQTGDA